METQIIHDLSKTKVMLGDFIRLHGLQPGMIIYLKNDGSAIPKMLIIGNATPYEGVSSISHDGWDWDAYNCWEVEKVLLISEPNNRMLNADDIDLARNLVSQLV